MTVFYISHFSLLFLSANLFTPALFCFWTIGQTGVNVLLVCFSSNNECFCVVKWLNVMRR